MSPSSRLEFGSPAYRRTALAMFFGGFATFAMLYGPQPLMPMLSRVFGLSAAAASTVLSGATGSMALMLLPASLLADRIGRKPVMNTALFLSAGLTLLAALAPGFAALVAVRVLFGIVLSGIPAVGMAYLSEEVAPGALGKAMGLYIAGNALGGMSGRFLGALAADALGWRAAMLLLGLVGLAAAFTFWKSLPPSRHFQPARADWRAIGRAAGRHFSDAGLPFLFACAFLLMGAFVSLYNYLGYRLESAPFSLRPGLVGLMFSLYLLGMFSSAWAGGLSDRFGRRNVLWLMIVLMGSGLALTLADTLWLIAPGVGLFTFGFFAAHSVASSWVGLRARDARALASAWYLAAYYLGSSLVGSVSGFAWGHGAWPGVALLLAGLLAVCLAISLKLRGLPPLSQPSG
ncbi:MFS transporter [Paludibacterium paludis]|uniref:MFS transporter n=1 Tax=Paludibacterium paludis TaxID=1225769 RepID=A0A918P5J1_9NEIS|nr:MFS transporter [Paludibacterium paludis]